MTLVSIFYTPKSLPHLLLRFGKGVNGKTFHLKKGMTMFDEENLLKSSTIYRTISGGTLEQYENYQVYTYPKWDYALFAYKNYIFSTTYRLFIIKNKKE